MDPKYDFRNDHKQIANWYKKNSRALPWRESKDPYRIWLSEVMLQQTTVVAVIPYFERFLAKFPTLQDLANAPESDVLEAWAGLGYYSRARNLHKAAKVLAPLGFPRTAAELLQLPGFGPYTSRAVASIAFGEKVGVLDGNVIRVLSRRFGLKLEWWNQKEKNRLQIISDKLAGLGEADIINQALMELGATVCTPQKVTCLLCPWHPSCVSFDKNLVQAIPLKKPRRQSEIWVWKVDVAIQDGKVALVKNNYTPFLKRQLIFPGDISKESAKPKDYNVQHSITHHNIFIQINRKRSLKRQGLEWVKLKDLKKINPSSLLTKVLTQA